MAQYNLPKHRDLKHTEFRVDPHHSIMVTQQCLSEILYAVLERIETVHDRQIDPLQPVAARPLLARHQTTNVIEFIHRTVWIHLDDVGVDVVAHHVLMQPEYNQFDHKYNR